MNFNFALTPAALHSLTLSIVHYLKVEDENAIDQRGIFKNFTKFCERMPKIPSNHLYNLFSFYSQNLYVIELEELMTVLYHKRVLNDVIPAVLIRIRCLEALQIFQKYKSFLKNLIGCPEELALVYGHITLCVLDMIKKTAVTYEYSESSNRLQTLTPLKVFRNFEKNEHL